MSQFFISVSACVYRISNIQIKSVLHMGGSPGLVMGGGSCSEGRGFESWHCIIDGHFSHIFVVKIVMMFV